MTALALTVLVAILWLAFVALGYWHGGWRQIILLAAMLLSYAVLSEWAVPNGHDLSIRFHWSITRTTTVVALLYLLVGTFVLGFLGGFALHRPRPLGLMERRLGAAMGVLTGGLLLALILRTLRSYAFVAGRGESLHASVLSRYLIEDVGYLLLGALVLGGIAAIAGLAVARRDEAREMVLLEAVATPNGAGPAEPQHPEQPAMPLAPALVPRPASPPASEPVYTNAPLIDWPTSPPPGTQAPPPTAHQRSQPEPPSVVAVVRDTQHPPLPLTTRPQLPPRVPPPLIYPVADLIAAQTNPAVRAENAPPLAPSGPFPSSVNAATRPTRPVGPPPGATHPAFVPPTAARPSMMPEQQGLARADVMREPSLPPSSLPAPQPAVMRDLNPPSQETPPPAVHERDVATHDAPPPVVRELAVTTQDVPIVRSDTALVTMPQDTTAPGTNEGTMKREAPARASAPPPTPTTEAATAAIPGVPPLPSIPGPSPAASLAPSVPTNVPSNTADEAGRPRSGYARVAVARPPGGRPDEPPPGQPHPQPPAPPEPLHPPLPTGPRVHPCPACGYPVRDHARYCPNCGSRQGR